MPDSQSKHPKIHAYIAQFGQYSRRAAEQLVATGKVRVNGQQAIVGQRIDPQRALITINKQPLIPNTNKKLYYLVNKPVGYVSSTTSQSSYPSVLNLLPKTDTRLYPVGRLDVDAEGLILITNDGDLAYKLSHPKFGYSKTYEVLVMGEPSPKAIAHLRRGVLLKDGKTSPAEVKIVDKEGNNTWLEITIHEGRYHQVKRMTRRVGYETIRLVRTKFGPFTLKQLSGKKWIEITEEEIISTQVD